MTRVDGSGVEADAEAHAAMEVGEGQASAAVTSGSTPAGARSSSSIPPRHASVVVGALYWAVGFVHHDDHVCAIIYY